MSLALLFHYLLLNMFRMLIHPSSGACDLFVELFHGCIVLVRCVLVLRCGLARVVWCGVVSVCRLTQATPPQPNYNVTPTHIEPEQYNHEITHQISRKHLKKDVLTSETC